MQNPLDLAELYVQQEADLAFGVRGVTLDEDDGSLTVVWIRATEPGLGHVSRWLDSLPGDRDIRFVGVTTDVLRPMLQRRGFVKKYALSATANAVIEMMFRRGTNGTDRRPD